MLESPFNKVPGLLACNSIKKRLQHRYFPVKFKKFLITPFLTEHLRWLMTEQSFQNQKKEEKKEEKLIKIQRS